jgi:hypothetical protein
VKKLLPLVKTDPVPFQLLPDVLVLEAEDK